MKYRCIIQIAFIFDWTLFTVLFTCSCHESVVSIVTPSTLIVFFVLMTTPLTVTFSGLQLFLLKMAISVFPLFTFSPEFFNYSDIAARASPTSLTTVSLDLDELIMYVSSA